MDTAAWPLAGDIAGTTSVRRGPGRPCRMPCVLFASGVLLCLSAASFSTPANGTLGKRSGAREPARGQVADANLSEESLRPPLAASSPSQGSLLALLRLISRVYCGKAASESEQTVHEERP